MSAAICYLTQNTDVRRTYLKTSLYFLFKHFNEKYKYPVIIFHEGDYDSKAQEEIIKSVRVSCRDLVRFQALHPDDFKIPTHIDETKLDRILSIKPSPVPYWRNKKYRSMCYWWLYKFMDYVKGYEYVMRLDDDSIIEEAIEKDLFKWMKDEDLNYSSNLIHTDCGLCCYGMKDFFASQFPDKDLSSMFVANDIQMRSVLMHPFRSVLSIVKDPLPVVNETEKVWMPVMYYNNFFMTRTAFWRQPEVLQILDEIDKDGSIFYFRWGDSPIQSLIVMLLSPPEKIKKASFAYSKRLQREAFESDDNEYYSYMPAVYTNSSCMMER